MLETKTQFERANLKLSVILPCLNEKEAIPSCMEGFKSLNRHLVIQNHSLEVILVDDGSIDGSAEVAKASYPDIKVIVNSSTRGYGSSLKRGFQEATGDAVAMMDVDSTYNATDFAHLIQPFLEQRNVLVIGARDQLQGGFSAWRSFGNNVMRFFARKLLYKKDYDICSGMRVFDSDFAKKLTNLPNNGFSFAIAIIEFAEQSKYKIIQLPISYSKRIGDSKLNSLFEGITHLSLIFQFWFHRSKN